MSRETYHYTKEDVRKMESRESRKHSGMIPKGSEASIIQSVVDRSQERKRLGDIDKTISQLPLPEDPPVPVDLESVDIRKTGRGQGGAVNTDQWIDQMREPQLGYPDVVAPPPEEVTPPQSPKVQHVTVLKTQK